MPRDFALRRCLASTLMIVAFLMVACSTVKNTPAQDEAWSRWEACSSQVPGSDIRNVLCQGQELQPQPARSENGCYVIYAPGRSGHATLTPSATGSACPMPPPRAPK